MKSRLQRRRKVWLGLLLTIIVIAQIGYIPSGESKVRAADNGLAQKPYMGWSSYSMQVYDGPSGNWISEAKIKKMSDAMHEKLQSHGYKYINIDAGWNGSMDEYGRPVPSAALYPGGFQNLVDYIHGNGQKAGLYLIPGVSPEAVTQNLPIYNAPGCNIGDIVVKPYKFADYWNIGYKIDFSNPCSQKYIDSVADAIASWGVDFVKFDSVTPGSGHNDVSIDARDDVKAWSTALGRHNIWFELSWALDHNYVDYWKKYANGWRVDWDVESYDREVGMTQWANIARLFPDAALWWRDAGPGGWNDFDSLNVGNGATSGLTKDERQTAATLWAASAAQFYTGDDLSNLDAYGLDLLTNDEVIAVNQAGRPVHPVSTSTNQQVWYANNGDGTYTVALFNLGNKAAPVTVNWNDIGLSGPASVRDLWSHSELGTYTSSYGPVSLEPHASRLFKITAQSGSSFVNDDDTGVRYTGTWTRNGGKELARDAQDLSIAITDSSPSPASASSQIGNQATPQTNSSNGTVSHAVYINDTDPLIQYSNKWGHSGGRPFGDYQDDVHYGEPDNGTQPEFSYSFTGTGIELFSEQGTSNGRMDVYIDGQLKGTVDAEGPQQTGLYSVYRIADLPQGQHTLRVLRNGTGQYYFILDALKVTTETLLGQPSANSFDKDQPADITTNLLIGASSLTGITNGAVSLQPNTDFTISGGNLVTIKKEFLLQQPSGQPVQLAFTFAGGDSQSLSIAITGTSLNPATAAFDKKTSAQTDVLTTLTLGSTNSLTGIINGTDSLIPGQDYTITNNVVKISKSYLNQQPVGLTNLTFTFLSGSPRTFAITVSNSASPGRYTYINDDSSEIHYTGAWNRSTNRPFNDYGKDVHYVEQNNDFFTYTFNGTGITYITEVDQGQGDVDIYIDGQLHGTAHTFGANSHNVAQQEVYTVSNLTPGIHTLKAVKKSGQFMLLDALKVQQPDLMDISAADFNKTTASDVSVTILGNPDSLQSISNDASKLVNPTDYEINGQHVTIKKEYLAAQPVGSLKLTFSFTGDYADDVHASSVNGDSYLYSFTGTGIELLAPTGPELGDIDIYLDGELKQTINAHSAIRNAGQSLYRVSSLSKGAHTLKAVKKSGSYMLVDAFKYDIAANSGTPSTPQTGGGGYGGGYGGAIVSPNAFNVVRTTQADGTSKEEVKLSDDNAKMLIQKSKTSGSNSAVISLPDAKDDVSMTTVQMSKESLSLLGDSGLDLNLDTANVKVLIANSSLKSLKDDSYFNLVPVKASAVGKDLERRANAATVVLGVTGGANTSLVGRPVEITTNLHDQEVTLVLPLPDDLSDAEIQQIGVYIEHSDGTTEFKKGTVTTFQGARGIQFTTNKFSTFVLLKVDGRTLSFSHEPYIQGYENNLFRPDNRITRAEMAMILSRIAAKPASGSGSEFVDVKPELWSYDAIAQVSRMGLMQGYADGTFRPDQPITRAEMAALAARFAVSPSGSGAGFTDTSGLWAEDAIKAAQAAGYLNGYADGSFGPTHPLTRAEAVTVINRVLGRGPLHGIVHSPWTDVPDSHWAVHDIEEASVRHSFEPLAAGGEKIVE
ncbi:X2-like carbohydrate binding domain-containing protein [Paenibacillus sp. MAH-36]|uniref:Alpha-galactosidase n=1 Tax=Paenibacillus violae TaxID=3077234 RepID=A0ABU3R8P0_9BACL|nr:X2-like carbohydrate binding domain-containing protein [Paenibacillus sp. PFR10]MDU0200620.1 X2-like carbohydrate binding domain-containing protein [Paenibacillus sp. PFR10]